MSRLEKKKLDNCVREEHDAGLCWPKVKYYVKEKRYDNVEEVSLFVALSSVLWTTESYVDTCYII